MDHVVEVGVKDIIHPMESSRPALIAAALLLAASWLLLHPYAGLVHDGVPYALLALARLHPDTLAYDAFLRFGSQDQYTLFSPLYAQAVRLLDLEPAAALLAFVSQLAVLAGAWRVARYFMPDWQALLGVALFVALPGEYGSAGYFQTFEPFLTPRLPAEALVLAALAAALGQRYWTAALCVVLSMLLHPIMGAAGAALLALTFYGLKRPRFTLAAGSIALVGSLAVLAAIAPVGRIADPSWLESIRATSPYLYPSTWAAADWSRLCVQLAPLVIGLMVSDSPALRRVCAGALLTVATGLTSTLIYCDWLKVILFTDLQAWRWIWVASILAIVLSPKIGRDCWRRGSTGRLALVLVGAAWIMRSEYAAFPLVAAALGCLLVPISWRNHRYSRLLIFGAVALMVLAEAIAVSDRLSYVPEAANEAGVLAHVRYMLNDGIIAPVILILAWLALHRWRDSRSRQSAVAAFALLACIFIVPNGMRGWTALHYTPALAAKYSAWRAIIAPHEEVLWPDNPLGSWYLLSRPSYWSPHQVVGAIFSRQKSEVMRHRNAVMATAMMGPVGASTSGSAAAAAGLATPMSISRLTPAGLAHVCSDPDVAYVAAWTRLRPAVLPPVTPDPAKPNSRMYLYRCAEARGQP